MSDIDPQTFVKISNNPVTKVQNRLMRYIRVTDNDHPFITTSGKVTNFYIDCKKYLATPENLKAVVNEMIFKLSEEQLNLTKAFCTTESGGIPLVTYLSLRCGVPYFYFRKKTSDHGLGKDIEGRIKSPAIYVDDVLTTGMTFKKKLPLIQSQGIEILAYLCIVNRSNKNYIMTTPTDKDSHDIDKSIPIISLFHWQDEDLYRMLPAKPKVE
jgi:orotate phosphoribosyltransferase